ncbi:MAG: twin-arginine translocation signal domain-containing protein [Chitinophagaceae bacterium]
MKKNFKEDWPLYLIFLVVALFASPWNCNQYRTIQQIVIISMSEQNTRRNFLKFSTLTGLGIAVNPLSSLSAASDEVKTMNKFKIELKAGQQIVSLLQTTDVHCQLHPHDELFWEHGKTVFRKTGGYANLKTYFDIARKKIPIRLSLIPAICFKAVSLV